MQFVFFGSKYSLFVYMYCYICSWVLKSSVYWLWFRAEMPTRIMVLNSHVYVSKYGSQWAPESFKIKTQLGVSKTVLIQSDLVVGGSFWFFVCVWRRSWVGFFCVCFFPHLDVISMPRLPGSTEYASIPAHTQMCLLYFCLRMFLLV